MKNFMTEYGLSILTIIVALTFILIASPMGKIIKNSFIGTTESIGNQSDETFKILDTKEKYTVNKDGSLTINSGSEIKAEDIVGDSEEYFAITIKVGENGIVKCDKEKVEKGGNIKCEAIPDEGYYASVTVDGTPLATSTNSEFENILDNSHVFEASFAK